MEPLSGHLLIAGTSLLDPNFRRAVVLIGHHDGEGAVGVVLNRASEVEVAVAVPPLAGLVEPGDRLFIGGPVSSQSAVVVADFEHPEVADVVAFDSVGFLPEEADAGVDRRPSARPGVRRVRGVARRASSRPSWTRARGSPSVRSRATSSPRIPMRCGPTSCAARVRSTG